MKSITVHNIDSDVVELLERRAREQGQSLNKTIKELLRSSLNLPDPDKENKRKRFEEFLGQWSQEEYDQFTEAVKDTRRIDTEGW